MMAFKRLLERIARGTDPTNQHSLRYYLGLHIMVHGLARLVTGSSATPINVFPSRVYGAIAVGIGLAVLWTTHRRLCRRWSGRIPTMAAAAFWSLIVVDAWGSWVSISTALLACLAFVNEVRSRAC